MALLLPCANEINAHLLRSLLLSHGIPSDVIHDASATAYGNWIMRPQLLISEEALDDGLELLAVPDEPIDDNFIEPVETVDLNEQPGLCCCVPGVTVLATIGLLLGTTGLLLFTLLAMVINGGRVDANEGPEVTLVPLWCGIYGLGFGIVCWPFIAFARSCHRREDGSLPLRARIFMLFLPQNPLFYVILIVVFTLLAVVLGIPSPLAFGIAFVAELLGIPWPLF